MHALQLTQRFPPALGGVEDHVAHLASLLPAAGVQVEVFTTDLRRDIPFDRFEPPATEVLPGVHRFRAVRAAELPHALGNIAPAMLPAVLEGGWDVIHAHAYGYFPTFAGSLGRLLHRGALVITPHADPGTPSVAKRFFDRVVPRATLRRADRVIALTPREKTLLESWGIPPDRIAVIPNGVDLSEFPPPADRSPRDDGLTALFVGRCYPRQKGLEVLLQAMHRLRSSRRVRLRIVGEDWGGYAVVAALTAELHLEDRVTLVGRLDRSALLREFAAADLFVLPSLFDSLPIAVLEAMAAGLPVVATRVGGVPDVVEDTHTGILVEPGDPTALAAALDALAADDGLRGRLGAEAWRRSARYSWDAVIPKIKSVYEEAVAECAS